MLNLIIITLLLLGSAFFSSAEGSLFSLGRHHRKSLFKENSETSTVIQKLVSKPFDLIVTILFADEIFNVAFSSLVGLTISQVMTDTSDKTAAIVSLAIASPTLLLFGEILPKTLAVKFPRIVAKTVSHPLNLFHIFISPMRWVVMFVSMRFIRLFGSEAGYQDRLGFSDEELRVLVDIGNEEGVLNEIENDLVNRFFRLEKLPVHKIITPMADCFMLSADQSLRQAIYAIKKRGYSRVPIYEQDASNIIGVLYIKDLLTLGVQEDIRLDSIAIKQCLRKPYFIPRTKMAFDLLRESQRNRIHFAIVVDEYGRVDGIVTTEDILEELFGQIEDETRFDVKPTLISVKDGSVIMSGDAKLEEFNDNYLFMVVRHGGLSKLWENIENSMLPTEGQETMGGFIFDLFGRFPVEGETIDHGSLRFTVCKIQKKRISEIKVNVA